MTETWLWLGTVVEYLMAVFGVVATIFFFIAVIRKEKARLYAFISGGSAIGFMLCMVLGTAGNVLYGMPEKAVMGTFQVALSAVFIVSAIFLFYFAFDAKNKVDHREAFFSSLLAGFISLAIGIFMLIPSLQLCFGSQDISTIQNLLPFYTLTYPFPIARITMVIVPLTIFVVGAYLLKEMKTKKYESESLQELDKFQKTYSNLDLEISRKIYHVVIIVVIVMYLYVGEIILNAIYNFTLNNLPQPIGSPPVDLIYDQIVTPFILDFRAGHLTLLLAVGWIFVILVFTDAVRIKRYRYYPIKMLAKIYRDKERLVLAPHVYLTTGALYCIIVSDAIASFLGYPSISAHIVVMTILVSALADAVATIIGITKGKHYLKKGKGKKTWEGWIAGVITAFVLGLLSYMILIPGYGGNIGQGLVLALVCTAVVGVIDFFSPPIPISDNILNPVVLTLALWGVAFLFFI